MIPEQTRPTKPLCSLLRALRAFVVTLPCSGLVALAQPVAHPVDPDSTASSRVVVAVQPIGRIRYDGLTLPVTSPSGEFLATQTGRAPAWEAILAAGPQSPPAGLRLTIHKIEFPSPSLAVPDKDHKPASRPPSPRLNTITPAQSLPTGLLLGRGADDVGFLVEAPQAGGARWIGRIPWLSAKIEWLAKPDAVCAHATLAHPRPGATDQLAYVQRPTKPDGPFTRLVVRTRDGDSMHTVEQIAAAGESFAFPVFSPDARTVAVIAASGGQLKLIAFDLHEHSSTHLPALTEIARLDLGPVPPAADAPGASDVAALHAAFQCIAAMQSPPILPPPPALGEPDPARGSFARSLCVFSPRDSAVVCWQPRSDQVLTTARGSFAAAAFQHTGFGLLLAGPSVSGSSRPAAKLGGANKGAAAAPASGLNYQAFRVSTGTVQPEVSLARAVEVVAGRMIPRATTRPIPGGMGGVTILLGDPKSGAGDSLEVLLLAPGTAE